MVNWGQLDAKIQAVANDKQKAEAKKSADFAAVQKFKQDVLKPSLDEVAEQMRKRGRKVNVSDSFIYVEHEGQRELEVAFRFDGQSMTLKVYHTWDGRNCSTEEYIRSDRRGYGLESITIDDVQKFLVSTYSGH